MGRFRRLWRVKGYLHVLQTSTIISISWVVLRWVQTVRVSARYARDDCCRQSGRCSLIVLKYPTRNVLLPSLSFEVLSRCTPTQTQGSDRWRRLYWSSPDRPHLGKHTSRSMNLSEISCYTVLVTNCSLHVWRFRVDMTSPHYKNHHVMKCNTSYGTRK